jgi:phage gp45-like
MTEAETIRMVRQIIRTELAAIFMGNVQSNESQTRSTAKRFSNEAPIGNMRSIQPYGISSRAPAQTQGLIVPVNGDPTHLLLLGHFDEARPVGADGETFLYNEFGQMVYLSNGKIQVGTKASAENLVLGQVFKTFMTNLLTQLQEETHIGNLGYATSVPINAAEYEALAESPIADEEILSGIAFTEK